MLRRSLQLLVLVSVALVLLLSCAPAKEVTPTPVPAVPTPTPAVPTPAVPVVTPTPTPGWLHGTPEGKLRVAVQTFGQESWNPLVGAGVARTMNSYLMEALIDVDPETAKRRPGLATEWSTADAMVWDFKLREGVKWSDGTEFTATDVKFSIDIHSKYPSVSALASLLRPILAGVDILGRYKVRVRLTKPAPTLDGFLSRMQPGLIAPAKYEKQIVDGTFDENPVGTGPFRLVKHSPASLVRYEALSEHYRVVPDYKTLDLLLVPEVATRVAMLKTGEVDVIDIGPENMEDMKASGLRIVTINNNRSGIGARFGGVWLPERDTYDASNPWLKKEFRMAVNHAINREELAETLFYGLATPSPIEILMPGTVGWNPEWVPYKYDPAYARQLIQQAGGWPAGKVITVYTFDKAGLPMLSETMEVIAAYLEAVGIPVRISAIEAATCSNYYRTRDPRVVGATWPTTTNFLPEQDKRTGSYWPSTARNGYFEDPELDRLVDVAITAVGAEVRQRTAQAVYQWNYDNYVGIPLVSYKLLVAISNNVEKFTEIIGEEMVCLEYVKVKH